MIHSMTVGKRFATVIVVLGLFVAPVSAVDFYLRAEPVTVNFPDGSPGGRDVPMWGFALDSAFEAGDGNVTIPGPMLTVPHNDSVLRIHVDNNLTVPISIVIPGQITRMIPVLHPTGEYAGRVRSFTHETPPGNASAVTYEWTSFRPGTFIYHSGTHPQIQVQMGLYGGVKREAAPGQVYPGVPYDAEVVLFFSEVDPNLHDAVAMDDYGSGKAVTSIVNYKPVFSLVNGQPHTDASTAIPGGAVGDSVLIRFFNAGLRDHTLNILRLRMSAIAEDGYPYRNAKDRYALLLPALKTKDVILEPTAAGIYPIYDRSLYLTNGPPNAPSKQGGMLTHIEVSVP